MQCFVFRSTRRAETFLMLPSKDSLDDLPEGLITVFGTPEFSFEFELTEERTLVQANADDVRRALETQGFYLQIPPENTEAV